MKKMALGFTGLAGVILSISGAMAAADTIVTSKAYVDARIDTREAAANKKTTLANPDDIGFPTTRAVKTGIDSAVEQLQGEINSIDLTPYEEKSNKAPEVTVQNRASSIVYPSMGAITNYVDTEIHDAISDFEDDSDATYQAKSTNTSVGVQGGVWKQLVKGTYTTINDSGAQVIVDVNSEKVASQASDITSTSTGLTTAGAVYNYISNLPAAKVHAHLATCTADAPCALIDNGAGQFVWVAIAQP